MAHGQLLRRWRYIGRLYGRGAAGGRAWYCKITRCRASRIVRYFAPAKKRQHTNNRQKMSKMFSPLLPTSPRLESRSRVATVVFHRRPSGLSVYWCTHGRWPCAFGEAPSPHQPTSNPVDASRVQRFSDQMIFAVSLLVLPLPGEVLFRSAFTSASFACGGLLCCLVVAKFLAIVLSCVCLRHAKVMHICTTTCLQLLCFGVASLVGLDCWRRSSLSSCVGENARNSLCGYVRAHRVLSAMPTNVRAKVRDITQSSFEVISLPISDEGPSNAQD